MIDLKKLRTNAEAMSAKQLQMGIYPEVLIALLDKLEAAQKDAARLMLACEFDGWEGVPKDKYEYAMEAAEKAGRSEPNAEDELNGIRALLDAAMSSQA